MGLLVRLALCGSLIASTGMAAQRGGGGGSRGGGSGGGMSRGGVARGGGFVGGGGGYIRGGSGGGFARGGHPGGGYISGNRGGYTGNRGGYGGYRSGYGRGYGYRGYGWGGVYAGFYSPFLYGGLGYGYWPGYDGFDGYAGYGYTGYGYDPYASYPYAYPASYGYPGYGNAGYGYPGYASSGGVTVVYPPVNSNPQPEAYVERPNPVLREYDSYGQEISREASEKPGPPPIYLIALKDHTIQAAEAYWVDNGILHYVTLQHEQKQAPLASVDREFSERLNRERRVPFTLSARP